MIAMHIPVKAWGDLVCSPGEWQDQLPARLIRKIGQRNRRMVALAERGRS